MTRILHRADIEAALAGIDVLAAIEQAFVDYSRGLAVVPPVGELLFDEPPGDVHIKYGYLRGGDYYVVKVASGFYQNQALGLPSSNGMMLVFSQQTGEAVAILLDEGHLTDLRTAAAGAVAAKFLAPSAVTCIGILGTGIQAEWQLRYLQRVCDCRRVMLWGRSREQQQRFLERLADSDYHIELTDDPRELAEVSRLIVTTTAAGDPLLTQVSPGTHITAVGADTPGKQELDSAILAQADVVAVDSRSQCFQRGETAHALQSEALDADAIVELGELIAGSGVGRCRDDQITVADLTGIATQDIAIATAVLSAA